MTTTTSTQYLDQGDGRIAYDVTGTGPLVSRFQAWGSAQHLSSSGAALVDEVRSPPWTCAGKAIAT